MSRVEQPGYKVKHSEGAVEIRNYGPMIVAEVEVKGERKAAINEGFRLIAAYICLLAESSGCGRSRERSECGLILMAERRPMGRAAVKDALERARRACP